MIHRGKNSYLIVFFILNKLSLQKLNLMVTNSKYLSALKEEKRREILQLIKYTNILTAK